MSMHRLWAVLLVVGVGLFSINALANNDLPIEDTVITAKIKSKIAVEQSLSVFKINISTNNGVVALKGNVNSDADASKAIELAQSTDGVKDVDASQLVIKKSSHPLADVAITAKVKGMFLKEKLFGDKDISAMSINVETNDGVVYLTGLADNQSQIDNAVKIAQSIEGVKKVDSRVRVKTN